VDGVLVETTGHGDAEDLELKQSAIQQLLQQGEAGGRWDLRDQEKIEFPHLLSLARQGHTDYVLRIVQFSEATVISGTAISIATTHPEGFSANDISSFDVILPVLGLAIHRMVVSRMVADVLRFYVGPRTANRVLAGDIERGKGQPIYAAILLADLKNFTKLSEKYAPGEIVHWLNEHFEAIGSAVEAEGGEILKLIGDSLLAIFPAGSAQDSTVAACRDALAAAQHAAAATEALNLSRAPGEAPRIDVDLVLHLGEVYYGNIGAAQRLDFTVIGRAVNEAARLEALCDQLGRQLLLSESFAEQCKAPTEHLGNFHLKGVSQPQAVYALSGKSRGR
jgi:adenylate cyclase